LAHQLLLPLFTTIRFFYVFFDSAARTAHETDRQTDRGTDRTAKPVTWPIRTAAW